MPHNEKLAHQINTGYLALMRCQNGGEHSEAKRSSMSERPRFAMPSSRIVLSSDRINWIGEGKTPARPKRKSRKADTPTVENNG